MNYLHRMKWSSRFFGLIILALCWGELAAQSVSDRLAKSFQAFEADPQLRHALSSLYVIDAVSGEVVFEKYGQVGMAPASTQKTITSVTALEILGEAFRFQTSLGYTGRLDGDKLEGQLYVKPGGDPSFGSFRFASTRSDAVLEEWVTAIRDAGIRKIKGPLLVDTVGFHQQWIPDGWIWEDVGNYYGAGSGALNWMENQYDLLLKSGAQVGDAVVVQSTEPVLRNYAFHSEARAAGRGTGDNAYIYLPLGGNTLVVRGTIPMQESGFRISGTHPDPPRQFQDMLQSALVKSGIEWEDAGLQWGSPDRVKMIHLTESPSMDSLIYWFNRKSVNLYGEALLNRIGLEVLNHGSTLHGVHALRSFWNDQKLSSRELNIYDGSGLSPLNRVTTHAQVMILKYAKSKTWFPAFFASLPEYNNMKMKSGTIADVKGFCGYHRSKEGKEYIFSFLVNNYSGGASALVGKMYAVLNELK
jgi:D-alanyl-D-alanine carboxypeptidase/D-alanyl-D-alanine-endopeptidase (penicillin-binding protein 4)